MVAYFNGNPVRSSKMKPVQWRLFDKAMNHKFDLGCFHGAMAKQLILLSGNTTLGDENRLTA